MKLTCIECGKQFEDEMGCICPNCTMNPNHLEPVPCAKCEGYQQRIAELEADIEAARQGHSITARQALRYEIMSSWWAKRIYSPSVQKIASKYFAWKVNLKHGIYRRNLEIRKELNFNPQGEHPR